MEEKYFAASNGKGGFTSYYGDVFGGAEKIYIVKGGPGTGKSYFMRAAASAAEAIGYHAVYIYCSSDQNSLDGVIIDGRVAILDGTAPHAIEASLPGARDELVDLGAFWNGSALSASRGEIEKISKEKSALYARAYCCLGAAGRIGEGAAALCAPFILSEKLSRAAARCLSPLSSGEGYFERSLCVSSVGMRGRVRFSTLEDRASGVISVGGNSYAASEFLASVRREAEKKAIPVRLARDPVEPERLEAVELSRGLLFTKKKVEGARAVNADRFISREFSGGAKKEFRELSKLYSLCLARAEVALAGAAGAHFELERIYGANMDFEAKENFTKRFIRQLLLALKTKM